VRTAQAASGDGPAIAMGDVNAELDDMPEDPPLWTYAPEGLPSSYRLGTDVRDQLADGGVANDAFAPLIAAGLEPQQLRQIDGRPDTRPSSGRVIDWILVSDELVGSTVGEVYDSTDEGQGEGLPKAGDTPPRPTSAEASDHLPVFVDVVVRR
jgi:endonuclease/exonuclease/phosphatase family metal-dependent hydrolase